jgi:hypothetical protein
MEWVNGILWALFGVCMWIWADRTKKYDAHIKECNEKRIEDAKRNATVEEQISTIENNSQNTRRDLVWLGDCMVQVCQKLNIPRSNRPD